MNLECKEGFLDRLRTSRLNPDYQEILHLHELLEKENVPHSMERLFDGWIIIYQDDQGNRIGDAIEHLGSYGAFKDTIEVFGFGLREPKGWLKASEAFRYFKTAEKRRKKGKR